MCVHTHNDSHRCVCSVCHVHQHRFSHTYTWSSRKPALPTLIGATKEAVWHPRGPPGQESGSAPNQLGGLGQVINHSRPQQPYLKR